MDASIVGAAPVRCTTARLKQDKADNVNRKWDSREIKEKMRCDECRTSLVAPSSASASVRGVGEGAAVQQWGR